MLFHPQAKAPFGRSAQGVDLGVANKNWYDPATACNRSTQCRVI
jgi:hypothetical protein